MLKDEGGIKKYYLFSDQAFKKALGGVGGDAIENYQNWEELKNKDFFHKISCKVKNNENFSFA